MMRDKARTGVDALLSQAASGAMVVGEGGTLAWKKAEELLPGMVMRIAAGERLVHRHEFLHLLQAEAIAVAQPDVHRHRVRQRVERALQFGVVERFRHHEHGADFEQRRRRRLAVKRRRLGATDDAAAAASEDADDAADAAASPAAADV